MAKNNISFNGKNYSIDESAFTPLKVNLKNHLSTTLAGSGVTIHFDKTSYEVDSTKLGQIRNVFTNYLNTIPGNYKVVVNGVTYNIDASKVSKAVTSISDILNGLAGQNTESLAAGLYETGAIALYEALGVEAVEGMLITSWEDLLANGTVHVEDGTVYTNLDEETGENASNDILSGDLVMPNDGSITNIGYAAFGVCNNLISIIIPDSVTSIDFAAFSGCWRLASVTIPNSIISISESAFSGSPCLTEIIIPSGVTSIGNYTFYGCSGLASIVIPDSVTSIGERAFCDCGDLAHICFTGTEEQWNAIEKGEDWDTDTGNYTVHYNYDPSHPYNLSYTLKDDDTYEVSGIEAYTKVDVVIPSTYENKAVTSIGEYAFDRCTNLISVTIPDSVVTVGRGAFDGCSNLISATLGAGLTVIPTQMFYDCRNLTSITIPNGVVRIEDYAFTYCEGLTSVIIPNTVTTIWDQAFAFCENLTDVYFTGTEDEWNAIDKAGDWDYSIHDYTIHFSGPTPSQGLTFVGLPDDTYEVSGIGSCADTAVIIPATYNGKAVTSIGDNAFYNRSSLTSVTIPDSVTSIGGNAFSKCTNLTSVTIPDSVTSIGNFAFAYCPSLTSVTIGDGVTSIGKQAFSGCTSLASIVIPDSVTNIGNYAFQNCSGLTSVIIGAGVTSISEGVFQNCSGLTSVTIGASVTSIKYSAFENCSKMVNITFLGTKNQWSAITKKSNWKKNVPATEVVCSDGTVAL